MAAAGALTWRWRRSGVSESFPWRGQKLKLNYYVMAYDAGTEA
jgi:hypothetical protein